MLKKKGKSDFDSLVNKFLKENLQMPQVSKGQVQRPLSNINYQSHTEVQNVGGQSNQPPKQKTVDPAIEAQYDNEISSLISTLPPEIQTKISSSQNLSQVQNALINVDPDTKKQIEDYLVHKTSAVPQE